MATKRNTTVHSSSARNAFLIQAEAAVQSYRWRGFFCKVYFFPVVDRLGNIWGEKRGCIIRTVRAIGTPIDLEYAHIISQCRLNHFGDTIFFRQDDWIEAPSDWSSNIVRGKTYDSGTYVGEKLWSEVQQRLPLAQDVEMVQESPAQYGESFLSRARLGQGAFRVLETEAYKRKCAITGESILPVLEAAHIKPFSRGGYNNAFNGLLLRSDFHKLFDVGLVTVTPELNIEVSQRIQEEWFNGKVYYRLHGQRIAIMPEVPSERPRHDLLRWHNENVFVG